MITLETFAGASARHTSSAWSSVHGTISIFSPRSSCTTACTRVPFHPDAGADRIDVGVLGVNRNLGASARLARALANLDDALVNFGHLLLEQLAQEFVGGAREHDRQPLLGQVNVENQRADAIALAIALVRNLLFLGQDRLGASEVDDHVLALEALHDARDDFALAILELVEDLFSLGVADVLDQVLLGRLRRDPAHGGGVELDQNFVADLGLGIVLGARLIDCGLGLRIGDLVDHRLDFEQLDFAELRSCSATRYCARCRTCAAPPNASSPRPRLITIVLSIPFSLETCSITRLSSPVIRPPRGAMAGMRRPIHNL